MGFSGDVCYQLWGCQDEDLKVGWLCLQAEGAGGAMA